jgi:hypothetical protein
MFPPYEQSPLNRGHVLYRSKFNLSSYSDVGLYYYMGLGTFEKLTVQKSYSIFQPFYKTWFSIVLTAAIYLSLS